MRALRLTVLIGASMFVASAMASADPAQAAAEVQPQKPEPKKPKAATKKPKAEVPATRGADPKRPPHPQPRPAPAKERDLHGPHLPRVPAQIRQPRIRAGYRSFRRPAPWSSGYYTDYTSRAVDPSYEFEVEEALDRAYRQGLTDGRHLERVEVQTERGLAVFHEAMGAGHTAFSHGHYAAAAREFRLAAVSHQGAPAARLCLGHSLFAMGRYVPAARAIRRALELQPKIAHLPLRVRGAYGDPAAFDQHLHLLQRAARRQPESAERWFLLGYVQYFSGRPAPARNAFLRAVELRADDDQSRWLAELAAERVPARGMRRRE